MKQYAMVIDLRKCLGCHTCAVTCKAQWQVPADEERCRVEHLGPAQTPYGLAQTFRPALCNHCRNPACVPVCPVPPMRHKFRGPDGQETSATVAATWKDPFNGIVMVDTKRCTGCGACVKACPYKARYLRVEEDKNKKADKCNFCVELLELGQQPACVRNCLADAMFFGDLNDKNSVVYKYINQGSVQVTPRYSNIGPNVYYYGNKKDLYLLKSMARPA